MKSRKYPDVAINLYNNSMWILKQFQRVLKNNLRGDLKTNSIFY